MWRTYTLCWRVVGLLCSVHRRSRGVALQSVTKEDAEDVVSIMKEALMEAYTDEFGVVDFTRAGGMSMAKQVRVCARALCVCGVLLSFPSLSTLASPHRQVKTFVATLNRIADKKGSATFNLRELREIVTRLQLPVPGLGEFIEVRSAWGCALGEPDVLHPRHRLWRRAMPQILNQQNYLLKKGYQQYQLQTSVYSQTGLGRRHRSSQSQGFFR